MKAIRACRYLLAVSALLLIVFSGGVYADEESLARQAEEAGKFRQALKHYVAALQSTSEGNLKEQQLREKIIKLAQKIQPPPAVPQEARRHMVRGRVAVKSAKGQGGFQQAAEEFRQALRLAPWLAEAYYNLGIVLDKIGKYDEAILNLKLYLLAVPDSADATQVQDFIYEIEYRQEQKQKEERIIQSLNGQWAAEGVEDNSKMYTIYNIRVTGKDSLTIEFAKRYEYEPPLRLGGKLHSHTGSPVNCVIKATLKGWEIDGTMTTWLDDKGPGRPSPQALIPRDYPVSGKSSEDGRRITLKSTGSIPGSQHRDADGYDTIVLKKR
jgi:tetratricopeptide (TPR) repeat protein